MRLPTDLFFLDIDDGDTLSTLIVEPSFARIETPEPWTYRERDTNPFMADEPKFDAEFHDKWEHGV